MRIAFDTFQNSMTSQMANLSTQMNALQNQVATGKRISQLDDDPATMRQVLDLQSQGSQLAQYRQNIASLQTQATNSYNAISGLQTISSRASDIATLADSTRSPEELGVYATEVTQLIQQGVQLMNSTSQGAYLFGGTQSNKPPFVATTDASGNVTGVAYQGNESVPGAEIAAPARCLRRGWRSRCLPLYPRSTSVAGSSSTCASVRWRRCCWWCCCRSSDGRLAYAAQDLGCWWSMRRLPTCGRCNTTCALSKPAASCCRDWLRPCAATACDCR